MTRLPANLENRVATTPAAAGRAGGRQKVRYEEVRKQAEVLVSQTFYGELLKQMRNSPWKDELLSGGKQAEPWWQMFDGIVAQKMSRGAGGKLVDAVARRIAPAAYEAYRREKALVGGKFAPSRVAEGIQ